jgi:hypothetical protein
VAGPQPTQYVQEARQFYAQARRSLVSTGEPFDLAFPDATEPFAVELATAYANLFAAMRQLERDESLIAIRRRLPQFDHYMFAWQLLWDASNSLLAACLLLRHGYEGESLAVARSVLERVACAIVLFDQPHLLPRFKADKLDGFGTKAVSAAGRVTNDLARVWGELSEFGSHVGIHGVFSGFAGMGVDASGESYGDWIVGGRQTTEPDRVVAKRRAMRAFTIFARNLAEMPAFIFFNRIRPRAQYRDRGARGHRKKSRG